MSGKKKYRSANDFLQYLKGIFSNRERHLFERDLEADPFAREAMEGLETIAPEQAEEDLLGLYSGLRKRMDGKTLSDKKRSRKRRILIYSAAASIASLLIVGTVFLRLYDFNPEQAEENLIGEEFPAAVPDMEESPAQPAPEEEPPVPEATSPEALVPEDRIVHEEAAPAEPAAGVRSREKAGAADETGVAEKSSEAIPATEQALQAEDADNSGGREPTTQAAPGRLTGMESQDTQLQVMKKRSHIEGEALYDMAESALAETASHVVMLEEGLQPAEASSGAAPYMGFESFRTYVAENLQFPPEDTVTQRAVVVLEFTVTPEGTIRDILPLRTPGEAFTRQAGQLLLEGPVWNPATEQEKKIEDHVRLRFVFKR